MASRLTTSMNRQWNIGLVLLGVMACMHFTQEIRQLARQPKANMLVARYQGDAGDGE